MNSEVRRDLQAAIPVAVLAFGAFALAYVLFGANNLYEFCHYADIAQSWAGGDGFSTRITEPGVLAIYEAHGVPERFPYPVLYRFPLYSALVAASVKVLGFSDWAMCLVNGLVHAALAALIVLLGRRLFSLPVAMLAAALYVLHPIFVSRYMLSGFTGPLLALILLILHYLLARDGPWTRKTAALAGAMIGLAYLARFNAMLFAPVYLVLIWRRTDRKGFLLALAAAALAVAPLLVFNLHHFGTASPYPSLTMNLAAGAAAGDLDPWRLYRTFSMGELLANHLPEILAKGCRGFFGEFVPGVLSIWGLPLVVLFFFLDLFRKEGGPAPRFWKLGLGLLLLQGVVFSFLRLEITIPNEYYRGRYFFWFAPTLLLAGCHGFAWIVAERRRRNVLVAFFVAFNLLSAFGGYSFKGYHFDPETDPSAEVLAALDPEATLLVSNMAFPAAAYYRLNTLEIPAGPGELARLTERYRPTHLWLDRRYYLSRSWERFLRDPDLQRDLMESAGFRPEREVRSADGRFVGILLTRRP